MLPTPKKIDLKLIAFLLLVICLNQLAEGIYLPGIPAMANSLGVANNIGGWIVTFNLIGYVLSQLIMGYFADFLRSKNLMFVLLSTFSFGAGMCCVVKSLELILLAVLLQGFGSGGSFAISQGVIAKEYSHKTTKILAYINLIATLSPMFSGMAGSAIIYYFDWRAIFFFLFIAGTFLTVYTHFLSLITQPSKKLISKHFRHDFYILFSNYNYIRYLLVVAIFSAGYYAFYAVFPFLMLEKLKLSLKDYSWSMLIIMSGLAAGRLLSGILIDKFSNNKLISLGIFLAICSSLSLCLTMEKFHNHIGIIFSLVLYMLSLGLISICGRAAAMQSTIPLATTAIGLLGVAVNGISALNSYLSMKLLNGHLGFDFILLALFASLCWKLIKNRKCSEVSVLTENRSLDI